MIVSSNIERRVEQLLLDRARAQGQLAGLGDGELAGIFKKIKKVAKKVGKVVKKVAPIAVGAATAYVGGVAAAKLTKNLLTKKKKAAVPAASEQVLQQAIDSGTLPATAPAAADPAAIAQQVAQMMLASQVPSAAADPGMQQIVREEVAGQAMRQLPGGDYELPEVTVQGERSWLIPGAIAAGFGVLLLTQRQRRRRR